MTSTSLTLQEQIEQAAKAYYEGSPIMSDEEFDALVSKTHPGETLLTEQPTPGRQHVRHSYPMLSLDKMTTQEELDKFVARMCAAGAQTVAIHPKLDGASLSLTYTRTAGLVQAVTRGNGVEGDDVMMQASTMRGVPPQLGLWPADWPDTITVRGEVVVPYENFEFLNRVQEQRGLPLFANPRNLAAGSLKSLEPGIARGRGLTFIAYDICEASSGLSQVQTEALLAYMLPALGFFGVSSVAGAFYSELPCQTAPIKMALDAIADNRVNRRLPVATDGAVIRISAKSIQRELGNSSTAPVWAAAFKFPPLRARTVLEAVELQMGKHGTITPVGVVAPVWIDGSTVRRVTLHNFAHVENLGLRIGDTVVLHKANDIIPQIVEVIPSENKNPLIQPPTTCPRCGSLVNHLPGEVAAVTCSAPDTCPGTLQKRWEHFVSRHAMDISGMGPVLIEKWLARQPNAQVTSLYDGSFADEVNKPDISNSFVSAKQGIKILQQIAASVRRPVDCVLYSLCIPDVGRTVSRAVMEAFGSLQALLNGLDAVTSIAGVGPAAFSSLSDWLTKPANRELMSRLVELEVGTPLEVAAPQTDKLKGQVWVITGELELERDALERIITANGGVTKSSVSKKTTHVLVGNNPGSTKVNKAKELGTPLVSAADFWKMIDSQPAE